MSWGACFLYYECSSCGKKYKYSVDVIPYFGPRFGQCPNCHAEGIFEKEGARTPDDLLYEEVYD